MSEWKMKIDPASAILMKRALQSLADLGVDEILVDRGRVARRRAEIGTERSRAGRARQYASLDEHKRAIANCQKCPLGATRTKFVYGVGNSKAEIIFIGEAPGRDEDLKGEPFVGRAGQLLDKILAAIKFNRDEIYIANILKCRPPNNRDPLPDEMAICMPYLLEQIRLINPKMICALGRISAQALLKTNAPIGKLRGKWHDFEGKPFLVTYHPAALLRFPAYKRDVWEDVQKLRAKYDELKSLGM
jgi:DNA polymerase